MCRQKSHLAHEYAGHHSRMSMFKQLYLSEKISEFASENIDAYICPVPIHGYIKNKFLTYTREVGDPTLSQNIELKYVVRKAKLKKKYCKKNPEDVSRDMASLGSG